MKPLHGESYHMEYLPPSVTPVSLKYPSPDLEEHERRTQRSERRDLAETSCMKTP